MTAKKQLGDWGEKVAVFELEKRGFFIVETNFHCRHGEIDIIAEDAQKLLIFIEVKTRNSETFGTALEGVTDEKMERFQKTVEYYLEKNNIEERKFRIDVITLDKLKNGNWKFLHIFEAF